MISVHDVSNLYRVPLLLVEQDLPKQIFDVLKLDMYVSITFTKSAKHLLVDLTADTFVSTSEPNLKHWNRMADLMDQLNDKKEGVRIVIAGKYTGLSDSYLSVIKGLFHASLHTGIKVYIDWIETVYLEPGKFLHVHLYEGLLRSFFFWFLRLLFIFYSFSPVTHASLPQWPLEPLPFWEVEVLFFFLMLICLESEKTSPEAYKEAWEILKRANGILVPGAFGSRGVEGKILAAKYARENKIPYFGICLGLQVS